MTAKLFIRLRNNYGDDTYIDAANILEATTVTGDQFPGFPTRITTHRGSMFFCAEPARWVIEQTRSDIAEYAA